MIDPVRDHTGLNTLPGSYLKYDRFGRFLKNPPGISVNRKDAYLNSRFVMHSNLAESTHFVNDIQASDLR